MKNNTSEHVRQRRDAEVRRARREPEPEMGLANSPVTDEEGLAHKIGYWIGLVVILLLSPFVVVLMLFWAFTGGPPLSVLRFMANKGQASRVP